MKEAESYNKKENNYIISMSKIANQISIDSNPGDMTYQENFSFNNKRKFSLKKSRKSVLRDMISQIQMKIESIDLTENLPFRKNFQRKYSESLKSEKSEESQKSVAKSYEEVDKKINMRYSIETPKLEKKESYGSANQGRTVSVPLDIAYVTNLIKDETPHNIHQSESCKMNNYLEKYDEEKKDRKLVKLKNVYDSSDEIKNIDDFNMKWTIPKDCMLKTIWDVYIFYIMLYCVTILTFRMGFSLNLFFSFFNVFEILIDISIFIDLILQFFIPYKDKHENLIGNHKKIFLNYLGGWFIFDLISCFPSSIIGVIRMRNRIIPKSISTSNIFKLFKCFRLLNFSKSTQKSGFENIFRKLNINNDKALKRVIKFSIITFFLVHISSCFWIYLGLSDIYSVTWLKYLNFNNQGIIDIYIASVYFNFVTVYTIGYGDIVSTNLLERIYNIFFLLIGSFLFSFTISSLSMIFFRKGKKQEEKKIKIGLLNKYQDFYDIPDKLYMKIRKTINHQIKISNLDKYSILDDLSNNLKNELHLIINQKYMNNFKIFDQKPNQFVIFLLPLLKPIITSRSDCLFSAGEFVEEIYFVKKGKLSIQLGNEYDNLEVGEVQPNHHFGEILMYTNEQSPYFLTVKSKESEIYVLKKNDFSKTKLMFDSIVNDILSESYRTIEIIEKRRKIITMMYEYESINEILKKIFKLDYFLLNQQFNQFYYQGLQQPESFDVLYEYDYEGIKRLFSQDFQFFRDFKNLEVRRNPKNENNFLKRLSMYDSKLIQSFYNEKQEDQLNFKKQISYVQSHNMNLYPKYKKNEIKTFTDTGKNRDLQSQFALEKVFKERNKEVKKTFLPTNKGIQRPSFFAKHRELKIQEIPEKNIKKKPIKQHRTLNETALNQNNKLNNDQVINIILNKNNFNQFHNQTQLNMVFKKDSSTKFYTNKDDSSPFSQNDDNISKIKRKEFSNFSDCWTQSKESKNNINFEKVTKKNSTTSNSLVKNNVFGKKRGKSVNLDNIVEEIQLNAIFQVHENNILNEIQGFIGGKDETLNEYKRSKKSLKKLDKLIKRLDSMKIKP